MFQANNDFKKHTQNVIEMKRDLESIFKRLKNIKQKLNKQMPEAYTAVIGIHMCMYINKNIRTQNS